MEHISNMSPRILKKFTFLGVCSLNKFLFLDNTGRGKHNTNRGISRRRPFYMLFVTIFVNKRFIYQAKPK